MMKGKTMALFNLTATQVALLASCIDIGLERSEAIVLGYTDHEDVGGENAELDLVALRVLAAELDGFVAQDLKAEITVMRWED